MLKGSPLYVLWSILFIPMGMSTGVERECERERERLQAYLGRGSCAFFKDKNSRS